jgi:hypothetical protein
MRQHAGSTFCVGMLTAWIMDVACVAKRSTRGHNIMPTLYGRCSELPLIGTRQASNLHPLGVFILWGCASGPHFLRENCNSVQNNYKMQYSTTVPFISEHSTYFFEPYFSEAWVWNERNMRDDNTSNSKLSENT